MNNSDHALYADGASSRDVSVSVPLSYALMWDLIRWSKSMGCEWFDFGGITGGHYEDGSDPLGGISDFKRRFSERVIEVGSEWELKPASWRTALSDRVNAFAQIGRRIAHGLTE
jgi:lipid II:glycine glycyltransferase (peptidoglycan interpeptide bridge formation enzyme)